MTLLIFNLTLRQLVFRRSTLLLAGLALLPVLVALVFRLSEPDVNPERWTARVLYVGLLVTAVLPLTALFLGTSALGDEFEDGTAIYLLTKPLPRWQILLPKVAAAWLVTASILVPSTVFAGSIALEGGSSLLRGFAISVALGSLAYCVVFAMLSVSTSRALIAGLVYVFLWEGAITSIFEGARYLSIRHYTMGLAGALADKDPFIYNPTVGGTTALILTLLVIAAALVTANRKLQTTEVREPS